MKIKNILTILLTLVAINCFSQIWDYLPEITKPYEPNKNIKRDNVKILRIYQYILEAGNRTGDKTLLMEQYFDSLGNTYMIIENSTDSTFTSKTITQNYESNIEYDSLKRPTKQTIGKESKFWIYEADKLKEFHIINSLKMIEKRIYTYQDNQIIYSKCNFYDNSSTVCDSVIATINKENNPIKIVSYNQNEDENILVMTIEYDDDGNNIGGKFNCTRIQFQYSKMNYRTRLLQYDCNGVTLEDEEYEYVMY